MSKFKIGDKVVAKNTTNILSGGKTYTVEGVFDDLVSLDEVAGKFFEWRFDIAPNTATVEVKAKPAKGFGTGKGTSQRIRDVFAAYPGSVFLVKTIADRLGLPSRQLHKRFAELVKDGYLVKVDNESPTLYKRAG